MLNHSRFYCSKRWWRWQWCNWNFMTYKAPVRSSSPKYQHPVLLQVRRLPAAQPTVTKQITSNAFSHSSTRRESSKPEVQSELFKQMLLNVDKVVECLVTTFTASVVRRHRKHFHLTNTSTDEQLPLITPQHKPQGKKLVC